ncbi:MAG: hypothetical protein M1833_003756 [Piccolia ochrophora]|nr:MAG: hypothetical protein M1833_003756 [Piccolia ochrophora]
MPAMTRVFTIPASTHDLKVSLHEPSLTADNLGLKTWAASYLLSKRLRRLSSLAFPTELQQSPRVLELGAGTGLVGITAAAVWGAHVHLTDLEEIQHNLSRNIEANNSIIAENSGSATSGTLNWATDTGPSSEAARYPIILAADSLYSPEHPHLLATTIERWLQMSRDSRAIVELPLRQGYAKETEEFKTSMRNAGFSIIYQGEEAGADDWKTEVNCWWGVFSYMVN